MKHSDPFTLIQDFKIAIFVGVFAERSWAFENISMTNVIFVKCSEDMCQDALKFFHTKTFFQETIKDLVLLVSLQLI